LQEGDNVVRLTTVAPAQAAQRQHALGRLIYSRSRIAMLFRLALVVLALLLSLVRLRIIVASFSGEALYDKDFLQGYTLARAIADGINPYLPTQVLAERYVAALPKPTFSHPTPHPPTLGLLLWPLSLFSYSTAAVVWLGLEMACLMASVYLLGRAVGARLSPYSVLGIAAALLIWYPFHIELMLGQLHVPMLVLLAGAWVALRSGRSTLGGALVGLAILLKPVPWPVLLWFLLRRDWRALATALSIISGGYLVAGCVVGFDTLMTYFTTVLPVVAVTYRSCWGNISLSSLAWHVFYGVEESGVVFAPPLVKSTVAAQVGSVGLPVLLLVVTWWALRKQSDLGVSWGLLAIVSILASPIAWAYYLPVAAIPAAHVIHCLLRRGLPSRETNLSLVVGMLLYVPWVQLATSLAVQFVAARQTTTLPSALAQLPLMPALALGALAALVLWLGPVHNSAPASVEDYR
jgi:hypothetical protein